MMQFADPSLTRLRDRLPGLRAEWQSKKPFRYLVVEDFLDPAFAEAILSAYPQPDPSLWDVTTYAHQRRKFVLTRDFPEPIREFFAMTASQRCRDLFSDLTGIPKLLDDSELLGGGLHQTASGGFLDVHVDFNLHPRTKLHRRLNLLVYMNKDWRPEFEGHLELWDMTEKRKLEHVAPLFNRAVLFETNEISFHGHPKPLATPPGIMRRSLAIYYYTKERDAPELAVEHNTIYKQTTGTKGYVKTLISSAQAAVERLHTGGAWKLSQDLVRKSYRKLRGLPPENR